MGNKLFGLLKSKCNSGKHERKSSERINMDNTL